MSLTMTRPVHDWTNDLQFLVNKPKRASRSQTPSIMMSMSALLEEDEEPPKVAVPPPSTVIITPPLTYSRSSTPSHRRTRSTASSVYTPPTLPSGPPDLPSYGTPAYTSLVVPPAPLPSQPFTRSTSISQRIKSSLRRDPADLSRSRLAQATMASIEVVGGLASAKSPIDQPPRLGFTHYRKPPSVSKSNVLVQVWAVGLDAMDLRLLGNTTTTRPELPRPRTQSIGRLVGRSISLSRRSISESGSVFEKDANESVQAAAQAGFIPGRSFVGRVMECGWEVRDEAARRGEWVIGLLDVRKSGALAEYIVVDRHRLHRVPQPYAPDTADTPPSSPPSSRSSHDGKPYSQSNQDSPYPSRPSSIAFALGETPPSSRPSSRQHYYHHRKTKSAPAPPLPPPGPTLEELALLPLGLAAYRAARTLAGLEGSVTQPRPGTISPDGELEVDPMSEVARLQRHKQKPRALVVNGHAGVGALVARMLVSRGWRVCIHAPGTLLDPSFDSSEEHDKEHMTSIQTRARAWGVEEVVFDDGGAVGDEEGDWGRAATVRAVDRLIDDGDLFDAMVDTLGGRAIWEAGERLLTRSDGRTARRKMFTTTVGDAPGRPVPTAKDNFRAGLRAMRGEGGGGTKKHKTKKNEKAQCKVSYAWVNAAQDVDWEGGDVRDGLAAVVRMALDSSSGPAVRPFVEEPGAALPFERAVEVFEGRTDMGAGVRRGGCVVVKVAG
ncbi:hypothetical protein C8F01DRAFT_1116108 [Mycena amicta]|nr:hypothetical protein C8F01DRAFT_1116108 [Mycena amicta]